MTILLYNVNVCCHCPNPHGMLTLLHYAACSVYVVGGERRSDSEYMPFKATEPSLGQEETKQEFQSLYDVLTQKKEQKKKKKKRQQNTKIKQ